MGVLDNNASTFTFNGNAESTTETVSGSDYSGGVIGYYRTNALAKTLTVLATTSMPGIGSGTFMLEN